jgi:hypothetical protein
MQLEKSNKPATELKQDTFYYTSPKKFIGKCKVGKKKTVKQGIETSQ